MLKWSLFGAIMCVVAVHAIQHFLPAVLEKKDAPQHQVATAEKVEQKSQPVKKVAHRPSKPNQQKSVKRVQQARIPQKLPGQRTQPSRSNGKREGIRVRGAEATAKPLAEPRPIEGTARNRRLLSVKNVSRGDE